MIKYYMVLRVPFPATDEQVRQAYLEMVKRFPPERYPEEFARISEAYEALKDETSRIRTSIDSGVRGATTNIEEEIVLLGRLTKLRGARLGLSALVEAEKKGYTPPHG